jgi:hypothetical protein
MFFLEPASNILLWQYLQVPIVLHFLEHRVGYLFAFNEFMFIDGPYDASFIVFESTGSALACFFLGIRLISECRPTERWYFHSDEYSVNDSFYLPN